jgi:hypothetical protein
VGRNVQEVHDNAYGIDTNFIQAPQTKSLEL